MAQRARSSETPAPGEDPKPAARTPKISSSIARGAAFLAAGRYAIAFLGWAGTVILVRVLSPNAWSQYSLIFAITGLIGTFADIQLGRSIVRDLEDGGDRHTEDTMASFLTLRVGVGFLCYVAAVVLVVAGGYPSVVIVGMAVAGLVLVIAAAGSALTVYFNTKLYMRATAVSQILGQVTQLVATVILAVAGSHDLVLYTIPTVLFATVGLLWQLRSIRGTLRVRFSFDRQRWRRWLKEAALLTVGTALGSLYMQVDTVLLSKLGTLRAVGIYAVGGKFATLAGAIAGAVSTPLLIHLTRAWPDDEEGFVTSFRRTILLLLVAGVAVAVGFAAFAHPIVSLLYGQRYGVGATSATGLVVAQVVSFFSGLCFVALVAMGRNLAYVLAAAAGVVVNVVLNVLLIPRHSYNGASLATLVTEVLIVVMLGVAIRRAIPATEERWLPWRGAGKVALAGGVMAAVAFPLRTAAPWEVVAVLAGAAYLAVLHLIKVDGPGGLRALSR